MCSRSHQSSKSSREMPACEDRVEKVVVAPFVTRDRDGPGSVGDDTKRAGARRIPAPNLTAVGSVRRRSPRPAAMARPAVGPRTGAADCITPAIALSLKVIGDVPSATAILDRFLHHATGVGGVPAPLRWPSGAMATLPVVPAVGLPAAGLVEYVTVSAVPVAAEAMPAAPALKMTWAPLPGEPPVLAFPSTTSPSPLAPGYRCFRRRWSPPQSGCRRFLAWSRTSQ